MSFTRRSKPLRAATTLADLDGVTLSSLLDGDLLVYDSTTGDFVNSKALTGAYSIDGSLSLTSLTATGALTAASLALSGSATITGDLTVDDITADVLTAGSLNVSGAVSLDSLTLAGSLTGVGFSFSGSGTIAGTLAVTGDATFADDVAITDALSVGGNATVTGHVLATGGFITPAGVIGASGSFSGSLAAGTLAIADTASIGTSLSIGGTTYHEEGIDYSSLIDEATVTRGDYTLLRLATVGIIEGTGDPNGVLEAPVATLYLRSDGYADSALYLKAWGADSAAGWVPLRSRDSDIDFLFHLTLQMAEALRGLGVSLDY